MTDQEVESFAIRLDNEIRVWSLESGLMSALVRHYIEWLRDEYCDDMPDEKLSVVFEYDSVGEREHFLESCHICDECKRIAKEN